MLKLAASAEAHHIARPTAMALSDAVHMKCKGFSQRLPLRACDLQLPRLHTLYMQAGSI